MVTKQQQQRRRVLMALFLILMAFSVVSVVLSIWILNKPKTKRQYVIVKQEIITQNPHFEQMTVTAYTAGYESTQKKKGESGYGVTASGTLVRERYTAACPKSLPFGTELYIPSLKTVYVCEDRGGAVVGSHIDLYVENKDKAIQFGKKKLDVLINIPKG